MHIIFNFLKNFQILLLLKNYKIKEMIFILNNLLREYLLVLVISKTLQTVSQLFKLKF